MTAPKSVEFFFDYISSYSYLANSQLATLGAEEIVYRPVFLGAIMTATGNTPPATVPSRGKYLQKDLQRWAKRYDIPLAMNPVFPQNTLGALRLALVALQENRFAELHEALFAAMWAQRRDLSERSTLHEIATSAGLNADDYLAASNSPDIKDRLKANTDEAVARGAFGAPTFFVGDQMYFGNDRLMFVREALASASN
ncbi:MAG: 2-hydroxychromene-2-carboxylate isomerase [Woeseia sp.]|nr:2-hydroxychromene-2-carboxylate isomerase [Woeseia sp.]MBT8097225.1 2-hydroxychromene-2-carboxylate isomerase [Woeseia sp.]NNE61794.1 2-hydroxychromene-2-carboxylate isomerase [Woeseia sp.]NNL55404.1 2-hydroxychromene-2-carboxylate isomerase [Woeseia sp.]